MGEYTNKLAHEIRRAGSPEAGTGVLRRAEYVSPAAVRIGGQLFRHNIHQNPECHATAGDSVLVAHIGPAFYVICKVV